MLHASGQQRKAAASSTLIVHHEELMRDVCNNPGKTTALDLDSHLGSKPGVANFKLCSCDGTVFLDGKSVYGEE